MTSATSLILCFNFTFSAGLIAFLRALSVTQRFNFNTDRATAYYAQTCTGPCLQLDASCALPEWSRAPFEPVPRQGHRFMYPTVLDAPACCQPSRLFELCRSKI
ncbi:hypothetical protein F4604DRAFT_166626 [Suillus subluteus]|nr:hypothetical protein F4604DRAFT_166626 [Suillus subluteus]